MGRLSWIIWVPKVNTGFLISKSRDRKDQRMKCDVRSRSQRERERDLKTALLTEDGGRRGCWPKDAGSL